MAIRFSGDARFFEKWTCEQLCRPILLAGISERSKRRKIVRDLLVDAGLADREVRIPSGDMVKWCDLYKHVYGEDLPRIGRPHDEFYQPEDP